MLCRSETAIIPPKLQSDCVMSILWHNSQSQTAGATFNRTHLSHWTNSAKWKRGQVLRIHGAASLLHHCKHETCSAVSGSIIVVVNSSAVVSCLTVHSTYCPAVNMYSTNSADEDKMQTQVLYKLHILGLVLISHTRLHRTALCP